MNKNKIHFLSLRQNWKTPRKFFEELNKEFNFNFDPCPSIPQFDGLVIDWGKGNSIFVNPPYGKELKKWIEKCYKESFRNLIVMLIPARTDTIAWHDYIFPHAKEIRFIKGRLKFDDQKNPAPFPSCIVIF